MIDTERFLQARKEALGRVGGAGGIGTLSEKALHAALKSYYEPDFESRALGNRRRGKPGERPGSERACTAIEKAAAIKCDHR